VVSDLIDSHAGRYAVVSYHINDSYEIPWGLSRLDDFYSMNDATPTMIYDGVQQCQNSDFALCLDQRLAQPSDMSISLSARQNGGPQWVIVADLCLSGGGSRNMRFYLAETLNDYPNPPEHSRNVLMQTPQTRDFSLAGGECTTIETVVDFDSTSWADQSNITVIAWAQAPSASGPADVYQAAIMQWPFPESPHLERIEIAPDTVTMDEGDRIRFSASGFDQFGHDFDIAEASWRLSGDGSGNFSPATGATTSFTATGAGNCVVSCSLGDISGTAGVRINADEPVLARIVVDPSDAEMESGESRFFTASGVDEDGYPFELLNPEWSLVDGLEGELDCAGAGCTFTAGPESTGSIRCTQDGISGEASVTVRRAAPVLSSMSISPAAARLSVGEQMLFTVSGKDQYGDDMTLENPEWRLEGDCGGSIDPTVGAAEITFSAGSVGLCTIHCREGELEASAEITVVQAGLPAPKRLRKRLP